MLYTTQAAPRGRTLYKRCDARAPHNRLRRLYRSQVAVSLPPLQCLTEKSHNPGAARAALAASRVAARAPCTKQE